MIVLIIGSLGLWFFGIRERPALEPGKKKPPSRFLINLPAQQALAFGEESPTSIALSPSGERLVYVSKRGDRTQLFVRDMNQLEAIPIPGTEDGHLPFFSPDGEWVAFFSQGKLKKVRLGGGAPITLCEAANGWGGTWGSGGTIVFTPFAPSGLYRVSAEGGEPQAITALNPEKGEHSHEFPRFLPDGRSVVFTVWTGGNYADSRIEVFRLDDHPPRRRPLIEGGSHASYLPTGHLLYARGDTLFAVPFKLSTFEISGNPIKIQESVFSTPEIGLPIYSVADNGAFVYAPGAASSSGKRLVWLNRKGGIEPISDEAGLYGRPRLSSNGQRIAFNTEGREFDIWVYDLSRKTLTRVTRDPGWDSYPVWSPDAERVVFSSARSGAFNLFAKAADGSGDAVELLPPNYPRWPTSWSSDGRVLAYHEQAPATGYDIWTLDMNPVGRPLPFLKTRFDEGRAAFSPDGRWIAFETNDSGRWEIFVKAYPGPGRRWQISSQGGRWAIWAPNGREIYYSSGSRLMVVPVETKKAFWAGKPELLLEISNCHITEISPDGLRWLAVEVPPVRPITNLVIVFNWFAEFDSGQS